MQLNGAIDRDLYGIDFKVDVFDSNTNELDIKGCAAFFITNKGNVPFVLDGNIRFDSGNCNSRSFENYLGLDYTFNKSIEFLTNGIAEPNCKLELVRVYIVKKPNVKTEA